MSDRTAMQLVLHRWDPARLSRIEELIDQYWGTPDGRTRQPSGALFITVYEARLGDGISLAEEIITDDPTVVLTVWEDPKYEFLGQVLHHHPDHGTVERPCDAEGNVVLPFDDVAVALRAAQASRGDLLTALRQVYARPIIEAIRNAQPIEESK